MSLILNRRGATIPGFPRSRGDEPRKLDALNSGAMFSPLTRG